MRRGFIEIDDRELRTLEVDISQAPGRMQRHATDATVAGLKEITRQMKIDAKGHRYLPRFGRAPDYQLITTLEGEAGFRPRNRKQGSLAHILLYGSVNNGPIYDYLAGPTRAMPKVEKTYADAAETSVLGSGRG